MILIPTPYTFDVILLKYWFINKVIDEVWVFGDKISSGVKEEIELAKKYDIPVTIKGVNYAP